jgi:hypothetical protein
MNGKRFVQPDIQVFKTIEGQFEVTPDGIEWVGQEGSGEPVRFENELAPVFRHLANVMDTLCGRRTK